MNSRAPGLLWVLGWAGCLFLGGCSRTISPAQDEARLRQEFSIPATAKTVSLWRNLDQPGTFGREGLRLVGKFQLSREELEKFMQESTRQGWKPSPLPTNVETFRSPPQELPQNIPNGMSFCSVWFYGGWVNGQKKEDKTVACEDLPRKPEFSAKEFHHYRAGVLDARSGDMVVVLQNYY